MPPTLYHPYLFHTLAHTALPLFLRYTSPLLLSVTVELLFSPVNTTLLGYSNFLSWKHPSSRADILLITGTDSHTTTYTSTCSNAIATGTINILSTGEQLLHGSSQPPT